MQFTFPARQPKAAPVVTPLMREVMSTTLLLAPAGGLACWTGPSRMGKTTTADHLADQVNEAYTPKNPDAFRARRFQVSGDASTARRQTRLPKRGIRALYEGIVGIMDERVYRDRMPEALAALTVDALIQRRIQLVMVDEAGTLSVSEIRGMAAVYDEAIARGFPLVLTFIGMDDIGNKLSALPQVKERVQAWCAFEPYAREEVRAFLRAMSLTLRTVDAECLDMAAELVWKQYGGVPGRVAIFCRYLENWCAQMRDLAVDKATILAVMAYLEGAERRTRELGKGAAGAPMPSIGGAFETAPRSVTKPTRRRGKDAKRG